MEKTDKKPEPVACGMTHDELQRLERRFITTEGKEGTPLVYDTTGNNKEPQPYYLSQNRP